MKYLLILLIAISAPAEEKVFRCNLDDRARVLVFENDQIACAYDTNTGEFWKVWKANGSSKLINFSGAVYDGRPGPQPNSIGKILIKNMSHQRWKMNDKFAQYYSYSPIDKTITMRIFRNDKSYVSIIEKPLLKNSPIKRQVMIKGLKAQESLSLGNESITTNGTKKT